MDHFDTLKLAVQENKIPKELASIIDNFYLSYGEAISENGYAIKELTPILNTFLNLVIEEIKNPFSFAHYHKRIVAPFNYYQFGLDILRPLVIFQQSKAEGLENVDAMVKTLENGDNVILLANHQTEPDPQAISLLLEKTHPKFAEEMIFVAGHRVTTDPLAIPFSMGRNLICIYSKRHMDKDPSTKMEKLTHNQRSMKVLSELLKEGGKCIYIAPSGGRDRLDETNKITIAPFDPQSLEMLSLMAKHAGKAVHFHTLTLSTYKLLPPPSSVEKELGERRHAHSTPIHLSFGKEIDMQKFPGNDEQDKTAWRQNRANYLWKIVADRYQEL